MLISIAIIFLLAVCMDRLWRWLIKPRGPEQSSDADPMSQRVQFRSYLRGTKFGEGCLDGEHTPVLLLDAHNQALIIEVVCSTCSDRLPTPELEDLPNYRSIKVGPLYQARGRQ